MKKLAEKIPQGCPICGGYVKGNDQYRFFCKRCNLLFRRDELTQQHYEKPKKPTKDKDWVEIPEPQPISELSEEELKKKFIVSLKSNKYHWINCPYIKKILRENLFYFNTEKEAKQKDYEPCVCMKTGLDTKHKFVRSSEGEEYHKTNCPYARFIKKDNRIYFDDESEAKKLKLKICACLVEED